MGMQLRFSRSWGRIGAAMALSLLAAACSDDDGTISPADANTMTQALELKVGDSVATKVVGELPQGSNQLDEPTVALDDDEIEARAGSTLDVALVFTTATGVDLSSIFAKIGDASQYYQIPVSGGSKRAVNGKAGVSYTVGAADGVGVAVGAAVGVGAAPPCASLTSSCTALELRPCALRPLKRIAKVPGSMKGGIAIETV